MASARYVIVGYRKPEIYHYPKTGASLASLGYFCGWAGNGWGRERDTETEAAKDALTYRSEIELLADREIALIEAENKDSHLGVVILHEAINAEGQCCWVACGEFAQEPMLDAKREPKSALRNVLTIIARAFATKISSQRSRSVEPLET